MPVDNALYDRLADGWWHESGFLNALKALNPARFGYMRRILMEELRVDPHGLRTLDVGCGGGLLAEEFARVGCRVTGVDPSKPSLDAARVHARASGLGIEYREGSGEALPFADASFGLGYQPKVLLAFLMSLFPIVVGAVSGLGEVEPDILDLAKLSGGSEWRIFRRVRLMHALPFLADAVKVAFPLALVGSIVGEFIGGNRGVGYLILSGQFNLDTPLVFACLLSITMFTSLAIGAVVMFEEVFLAWRPSRRR